MNQIALLGCAHIHTPGFVDQLLKRSVPVKGVWDHDADRAAKNAEKLGTVVSTVDDLLADPEVGAVVICSETNHHRDLVTKVAAAGKGMFVEKPLGMNGEDSEAMVEAIEAAGVIFHTGYFMRGVPTILKIKELVDTGFFGQITHVRFSNCHSGSLGGWFDGEWRWMADVSQAGVGAFGDLGTHALDLMLWIFGEATSVTGAISMGTARYPDCDEVGEAVLKFESGVLGSLTAGWTDVANPISVQICGTKGHAYLTDTLHVAGPDGKFAPAELPAQPSSGFGAFLDWFAGEEATLVTAREAFRRDATMSAIYQGAREGRWVTPIA